MVLAGDRIRDEHTVDHERGVFCIGTDGRQSWGLPQTWRLVSDAAHAARGGGRGRFCTNDRR
jgi:hypothetical protein